MTEPTSALGSLSWFAAGYGAVSTFTGLPRWRGISSAIATLILVSLRPYLQTHMCRHANCPAERALAQAPLLPKTQPIQVLGHTRPLAPFVGKYQGRTQARTWKRAHQLAQTSHEAQYTNSFPFTSLIPHGEGRVPQCSHTYCSHCPSLHLTHFLWPDTRARGEPMLSHWGNFAPLFKPTGASTFAQTPSSLRSPPQPSPTHLTPFLISNASSRHRALSKATCLQKKITD